ncbi:MAG: hypothetical protein JF621_06460 [Streptomyces turgidiscabies]|nr:hypothetical protein [Streptomyces turgidiscabies]
MSLIHGDPPHAEALRTRPEPPAGRSYTVPSGTGQGPGGWIPEHLGALDLTGGRPAGITSGASRLGLTVGAETAYDHGVLGHDGPVSSAAYDSHSSRPSAQKVKSQE